MAGPKACRPGAIPLRAAGITEVSHDPQSPTDAADFEEDAAPICEHCERRPGVRFADPAQYTWACEECAEWLDNDPRGNAADNQHSERNL